MRGKGNASRKGDPARGWFVRGPIVAHRYEVAPNAPLIAGPLCGGEVEKFPGDNGLTASQANMIRADRAIIKCFKCRKSTRSAGERRGR